MEGGLYGKNLYLLQWRCVCLRQVNTICIIEIMNGNTILKKSKMIKKNNKQY